MQPEYYTIFQIYKAKWYKRPFLWLLGKPTKTVDVYHNVTMDSLEVMVDNGQIFCKAGFTVARKTT